MDILKDRFIINTETISEYNEVIKILGKEGFTWRTHRLLTNHKKQYAFDDLKEKTCLSNCLLGNKAIGFSDIEFYSKSYPDVKVTKAKEFIKSYKEANNMVEEKYVVSKEFILEAYNEACSRWKSKLEKEFPTLLSTVKAGDKFLHEMGHTYMVTNVGNGNWVMVDLNNGLSYGNSVIPIEKGKSITLDDITGGNSRFFTRID